MFRDLLSSRLIQAGLVFFLLCVGGSLLYSWLVHRTTEVSEFAKTPLAVESPKNKQATSTAPVDFQTEGVVNTPDENTDTPMSDTTEALPNETEFANIADAFLPDDLVSEEEAPAEEVAVSPFGFGPYPEIPEGAPIAPFDERSSKNMELLGRVMVKKWNEGDRFVGGTMTGGNVYLIYPNILYVKWEVDKNFLTGKTTRYISRVRGPSTVRLTHEEMKAGKIPPGFQVIDIETGGLDPYEVLNLR